MRTALLRSLLALALASGSAVAQAPGDVRVALVIGNAAYPGPAALRNPVNDAVAVGDALRGMGFQVVQLRDAPREQMIEAVRATKSALQGKHAVAMLYYAGHAVQLDWHNFMVPVDARLQKPADVPSTALDVAVVLDAFRDAGTRMNILVLDACRDNPFSTAASGKGLAPFDAPTGSILAFATAPGNVAQDGEGEHGIYTEYLLKELVKPQSRIEDVFKRTRFAVRQASAGKQVPWETTSLEEDFMFNAGKVVAAPKPDESARQRAAALEKADWDKIRETKDPGELYAYLAKFPSGSYSELAQARLEVLQRPTVVPVAGQDGIVPSLVTDMDRDGDRYDIVVTEGLTGNVESRATIEMRAQQDEFVQVVLSGAATPVRFARGGFIVEDRNGVYDPPIPRVPGGEFKIGAKTSLRLTTTMPGGKKMWTDITVKTVARETIDTAMGKINTFRVESDSISQNGNRLAYTSWYDPQWGHPMRVRVEFRGASGAPVIRTREVVARSRRS